MNGRSSVGRIAIRGDVLLTALCVTALWVTPALGSVPARYAPQRADFETYFYEDAANRRLQAFSGAETGGSADYWTWVQRFYAGYGGNVGWYELDAGVLKVMRAPAAQRRARQLLNEIGRLVAREWAKDNAARNIDSDHLTLWSAELWYSTQESDPQGSTLAYLEQLLMTVKTLQHPIYEQSHPDAR